MNKWIDVLIMVNHDDMINHDKYYDENNHGLIKWIGRNNYSRFTIVLIHPHLHALISVIIFIMTRISMNFPVFFPGLMCSARAWHLALLLDTVRQHLWSKGDLIQGLRGRDLG